MPVRSGHHRIGQQRARAPAQRLDFRAGDLLGQCVGELAVKRIGQDGHARQRLVIDRLAGPPPQHCAQFVLDVQADTVVHPVHAAVEPVQNVAALAIGVVDQDVEHGHPP